MLAIVLVFLMVAAAKLENIEINCERIDRFGSVEKCCYLNDTTVIVDINVTLGGLEIADVHGISFVQNKKIQRLPVKIYKKIPNLVFYWISSASIKEISALNFEKLLTLEVLDLSDNQIEFIPDYCFQGLSKLSKIDLST